MGRVLPILFNTDMVRAILRTENPKTATRRAIKGSIPEDAIFGYTMFTPQGYISCRGTFSVGYGEKFLKLPCQPGDILYVRETWFKYNGDYIYKASAVQPELFSGMWRPSIHMPKEAARIWLKVTNVRVERLRDIDDNGAHDEGAGLKNVIYKIGGRVCEFAKIWNSTIKKSDFDMYSWDANPWVWVIWFERCEKPEVENAKEVK